MNAPRPDGAARREALLDAALICFDKQGLVRTGIEDVRKAAGASPSSVYHQFQGLPELITALLERTFVRRYRVVTDSVLMTRTAKTAVHALVDAHLAWVFGSPTEARFMYRALALDMDEGRRQELRATKEQIKAELYAHLVKLGVDESIVHGGMIDIVLLGVTHQACRTWLTGLGHIDPKWMQKTLPGLAWQTALAARGSSKKNKRSVSLEKPTTKRGSRKKSDSP